MSKIEEKKEEEKILKNNITPEFFKKAPYMAIRFKIVIKEMKDYYKNCEYILKDLENAYSSLSKNHLTKLLFNYKDKIEKVKKGIQLNQDFYNKVVSLYIPKFDYIRFSLEEYEEKRYFVEYLIRGFFMSFLMRDWTNESKPERDNNNGNVLKELKNYINYYDKELMKKNNYKVLVPGTGCSRMTFELAIRGFEVEANDFCYIYFLSDDY